jgi:hypothetical protein
VICAVVEVKAERVEDEVWLGAVVFKIVDDGEEAS